MSVINSEEIRPAIANRNDRPKILLADDHHLILDALRTMMSGDFDVLAVDNSGAFIDAVDKFQPDAAILDINMPGGDGFSTAREVLRRNPSLPIVFLSMYGEPRYLDQAAQVGAKAYLSKVAPAQELISAIHTVLEGEVLLPPSSPRDETSVQQSSRDESAGKSELTARQREVLRLIALGSSAKDIANQLNISVRTAEFHRAAIMQRLGLHSTAQMTRYAIANDIA
ncbi:MAG: response regulator transcription factor [Acidobacteriaceae bacterium]|nr:response regulator transcription factor [Acidobacteriaceae bacterium]